MPEIKRRINFVTVELLKLPPNDNTLMPVADSLAIFREIEALPATYPQDSTTPSRYLRLREGNDILMQIDAITDQQVRGRTAYKRRTNLPPIERAGNYEALELSEDAGLAEISHFIYFPERKAMAYEFNFFAPRIGRWGEYIADKTEVDQVHTEYVVTEDRAEALAQLDRLSGATIRILRDGEDVLQNLSQDLVQTFRSLKEGNNARELEVTLRLGSRKKAEELDSDWIRRLPRFLRRTDARHVVLKAEVNGRDPQLGQTIAVDMLEQMLTAVRRIETISPSSKAVPTTTMYSALESAYEEVQDRIP
jgi:hypothetical protein